MSVLEDVTTFGISSVLRCLIVKTEPYDKAQVAKVVQVRAGVEGLKLGPGVLDKLAAEGERASLRYIVSTESCLLCSHISIDTLYSYSRQRRYWQAFQDDEKLP